MADNGAFEAVVVGSGFGGAITACRLSKKWPGKVLVLERGKRYPMGAFPRTPHEVGRNFWNLSSESRSRPKRLPKLDLHGMFDIRTFGHMDAVLCAGLGGGSLIYANVFMEPPDEVFAQGWPESCKKYTLRPYYQLVKAVLGARPIPASNDPRRRIRRTKLFQKLAKEQGKDSQLVDINVFFGNDFAHPTPIGTQERNRYGALQTSCVYCAECDVGCNTHSKNTLDLNYLFVAENRYEAKISTEHLVEKIVPVAENGADDPHADGDYGYRVYYRDLNSQKECSVFTRRVIVAAGTLGSNELLLRCRDVFKTLPNINKNLGQGFSGNGDFLSFVIEGKEPADPNYGPVITQRTDYNLFGHFDRERAFILEDASYPAFAAWYVEGIRPRLSHFSAIVKIIQQAFRRWFLGKSMGRIGDTFHDLLGNEVSYQSSVLLCMGLDRGNGTMTLSQDGYVQIHWPYRDSLSLYRAMLKAGKHFRKQVGAKAFVPLPNWWWPFRRNITVHPLGGCRLAENPGEGVTSAKPEELGQVFGYKGLYVADGSIVPTAVGANPIATISALAERVAEGITGIKPDPDL
ncbi:glucose-methanol-choline oxidoreductase [Nitrosococcus halophilus Nc 4]|uniref:Cholesterol oxidase n=1 Tax=Nitrosococcus halophilus (strain Nc4) TaxID=472759 RepID=D5C0G3_NITHN|nr:GMC oxidoreductase [Nitrosococcus halophilus]ADE14489.1 glucose-methanol-choline oxidoreductase [Nitrosococcus halophilus Nc 4]